MKEENSFERQVATPLPGGFFNEVGNMAIFSLAGEDPLKALLCQGFAFLSPGQLAKSLNCTEADFRLMAPSWEHLPLDQYLRDGGRYRRRRHSCWIYEVDAKNLSLVPHRAHWQSTDYNALHGGLERWFEPIEAYVRSDPLWVRLLALFGCWFAQVALEQSDSVAKWFIEAHQFRIDTTDGVGRPTPEGAHRDGVDFVVLLLVARNSLRGGETRIFEAEGPNGVRFIMKDPWSALLLDDRRVIHEATPIQPDGPNAKRDTLVLTYRRAGFQAPSL